MPGTARNFVIQTHLLSIFNQYRREKQYCCCLNIRLTTAIRSRAAYHKNFGHGRGHNGPCTFSLSLSLITIPDMVAVSHAVSAHVGSSKKKFGDAWATPPCAGSVAGPLEIRCFPYVLSCEIWSL